MNERMHVVIFGAIVGAIIGGTIGKLWPVTDQVVRSDSPMQVGMPLMPGMMAIVGDTVIENASTEPDRFRADRRTLFGGLMIEVGKNITRAGDAKDFQALSEQRVNSRK